MLTMILDEETFYLFAAKHYDNPNCHGIDEFHDDLKKFQYLKRLFKKYTETGELKTRLILNHLVVIYNCFGGSATNMLFMKLEGYHEQLKPFVLFLNYLPEKIDYDEKRVRTSNISLDEGVIEELRKI